MCGEDASPAERRERIKKKGIIPHSISLSLVSFVLQSNAYNQSTGICRNILWVLSLILTNKTHGKRFDESITRST